jgi:hypothetical protein
MQYSSFSLMLCCVTSMTHYDCLLAACLQAELLHVIAVAANERPVPGHRAVRHAAHRAEFAADIAAEAEARRVRQRRE